MKKFPKFLVLAGCIIIIMSVFAAKKAAADGCTNNCEYNPDYACIIYWSEGNTTTCYHDHSKSTSD